MSKIVIVGSEATKKLLDGVNTLGNAVRETLGPKGRHVIVENEYQYPTVTKDGVTVAQAIDLPDPVENLGAQIVKQAARTTVTAVGDGTTTATILAQELFSRAHQLIEDGKYNPVDIKNFLERSTATALEKLDGISTPVGYDPDKLKQVATISANNDEFLGGLISEAIVKTQESGIVMVEESKSTETYVDMIEGCRIDKGYTSPYYINNPQKMTVEYESPLVFITDRKIRSKEEIVAILEPAIAAKRPLLIVADEIEAQAIYILITNRMRGLQVVAIKAPGFGERRTALLEDMAVFTGAKYFSDAKGDKITKCKIEDYGACEKIVVTSKDTTLVGTSATPEQIETRANQIRAEVASSEHPFMADLNKQRLASLTGSIGMIYVGGTTEAEMRERKFRIEDALQATQAASKKGIVAGGGIALMSIIDSMYPEGGTISELEAMFCESLLAPFKQIITNAGKDTADISVRISEFNGGNPTANVGYNANTDVVEDLIEAGVIDPTLVIASALSTGTSVAQLLITTSATVCPVKTQDTISPMGDSMGMLNQ